MLNKNHRKKIYKYLIVIDILFSSIVTYAFLGLLSIMGINHSVEEQLAIVIPSNILKTLSWVLLIHLFFLPIRKFHFSQSEYIKQSLITITIKTINSLSKKISLGFSFAWTLHWIIVFTLFLRKPLESGLTDHQIIVPVILLCFAIMVGAWAIIYALCEWANKDFVIDAHKIARKFGVVVNKSSLSLKLQVGLLGLVIGVTPIIWMAAFSYVIGAKMIQEFSLEVNFFITFSAFLLTAIIWAPLTSWFFAAAHGGRVSEFQKSIRKTITRKKLKEKSDIPAIQSDEVGLLIDDFNQMTEYLFDNSKKLEQALSELNDAYITSQKALKSRDEFLSIAAHELRTPITTLKLQIQVIQHFLKPLKKELQEKEQKELSLQLENIISKMNKVEKSSDKITSLVDYLLNITRIRSGIIEVKKEKSCLNNLVEEVIDHHKNANEGSQIDYIVKDSKDITCFIDPLRTEQIVSNLISNAIKYGEGLPITVTLFSDLSKELAYLEVADQGPGIPKDKKEEIFVPFERLKCSSSNQRGLGLGLYVVKKLTEIQEGEISVKDGSARGTVFTVSFPLFYEKNLPN